MTKAMTTNSDMLVSKIVCPFCGSYVYVGIDLLPPNPPVYGEGAREVLCVFCGMRGFEIGGVLHGASLISSPENRSFVYMVTNDETHFSDGPWYVEKHGERICTVTGSHDNAWLISRLLNENGRGLE
jgi:hypothetical protein